MSSCNSVGRDRDCESSVSGGWSMLSCLSCLLSTETGCWVFITVQLMWCQLAGYSLSGDREQRLFWLSGVIQVSIRLMMWSHWGVWYTRCMCMLALWYQVCLGGGDLLWKVAFDSKGDCKWGSVLSCCRFFAVMCSDWVAGKTYLFLEQSTERK